MPLPNRHCKLFGRVHVSNSRPPAPINSRSQRSYDFPLNHTRLLQAPNKHFKTSERYKNLINVRVATKFNAYREFHKDAQYLFSRNKYRWELATLFSNDIGILSIDDMSKIKVGAPAVSRYHQLKAFFPINDGPNLSDHDFPVPRYHLSTSGYMFLTTVIKPAKQPSKCICVGHENF